MTEYRGIVYDRLKSLPQRKTKKYNTYQEAHDAAEKLCARTMQGRGEIEVEEVVSLSSQARALMNFVKMAQRGELQNGVCLIIRHTEGEGITAEAHA